MQGSYTTWLVALSYGIAIVASYAVLDIAERIAATRGRARTIWLAGGAVALGTGIWSMHFTGMLAFVLPFAVNYDLLLVLASLLVAIAAAAAMLLTIARRDRSPRTLLLAGLLAGTGIAAMHYLGMAAMVMPATLTYRPLLVVVSLAIAVGASIAALWLAFRFSGDDRTPQRRLAMLGSALVMALAITGMHYTGMTAAHFHPLASAVGSSGDKMTTLVLAVSVAIATLLLLGIALISTLVDRRMRAQASQLVRAQEQYASLFARNPEAVFALDRDGQCTDANPAATALTNQSVATLAGRRFGELIAPADSDVLQACFAAALTGSSQSCTLVLLRADHQPSDIALTLVPVVLDETIVGVYAIARDITSLNQATHALHLREAELLQVTQQQKHLLEAIRILSTPILPIAPGVLIMPLVGSLSIERSVQATEQLLLAVERQQARAVILDVTGVAVIDTAVASHLLTTIDAVRLLGATSIVVGVSPEIAQTIVQLGIDLRTLRTERDLQAGIARAMLIHVLPATR